MKITKHTLAGLKACKWAVSAFVRHFPDGASCWSELAAHPDCDPAWVGWIAVNAPGLKAGEREEFRRKADNPAEWAGIIAVNAPGLTAGGDNDGRAGFPPGRR